MIPRFSPSSQCGSGLNAVNSSGLLFVSFLRANFCDLGSALVGREFADLASATLAIGAQLIDLGLKFSTLLVRRD